MGGRLIVVGAIQRSDGVTHYGGVITLTGSLVEYALDMGLDVVVVNTIRPGFTSLSMWERATKGTSRIMQLVGLLRKRTADGVVIFSGSGWSFCERVMMAAVCRVFRVPCVLFVVDGWFFSVRHQSQLRRWTTARLLRIPYRLAASGSEWVELFSELGVPAARVVRIHYWLPKSATTTDTPKAVHPGEPVRFLFVGWMIAEKGVSEIIAALDALLGSYDFRFTFVGAGKLLKRVQDECRCSSWVERVWARGWVSPDRLALEFSTSHVFVLPSYAEGFPLSLVEAMTNGMPAICTDVGGISDSLQDGVNGFLIRPKDKNALTRAMEFYLQHPSAVITHSQAALRTAQTNHDADINCKRLLDSIRVDR